MKKLMKLSLVVILFVLLLIIFSGCASIGLPNLGKTIDYQGDWYYQGEKIHISGTQLKFEDGNTATIFLHENGICEITINGNTNETTYSLTDDIFEIDGINGNSLILYRSERMSLNENSSDNEEETEDITINNFYVSETQRSKEIYDQSSQSNDGSTPDYEPTSHEIIYLPNGDIDPEPFIIQLNRQYITSSDLHQFTRSQIGYIRNGILALSGRIFIKEEYSQYFMSKDWYIPLYPTDQETTEHFNDYQTKNVMVCVEYEEERGWR